jgi:hypothetical protein
VSAANAPMMAARLDFQVDFQQTGNHSVWVRMSDAGLGGSDNSIWTAIGPTAPPAAATPEIQVGQQAWTWLVGPAIDITATGPQIVSIYMREDGVAVDAIAISRNNSETPIEHLYSWAYQNNPSTPQPNTCNADPFDTSPDPGDQDDVIASGSRAACFANGPGSNNVNDMSGNVKEFTAQRAAGINPLRGGASNNEVNGTTCQLDFTLADDAFFFPNAGFRCCR